MKTTNGKRGGNLVGKPHNDTSGNPVGGIKAVVTDAGGKPVELEGGEVIINKEASKKHWKELSKINQSAGNGVPIDKPIDPHDEDPSEYKEGGKIIEFNINHVPNSWILTYAKSIKKDHPEIWKLGGNIYGNTAFENLSRVSARGYWLDSEEWMYIKWRSYVARHRHDFRIEGVVAMLKWVDKVDKGWRYMKDLIEAKIKKGSAKPKSMKVGGSIEFKPEKKGTLIKGSEIIKYAEKVNGNYRLVFYSIKETKGKVPTLCDAFDYCKKIDTNNVTPNELIELIENNNLMEQGGNVVTYKNKFNKKYGFELNESHSLSDISKATKIKLSALKDIYDKGIGAYKTNPQSVRPNVKSQEQWAMARVYSAVMGGKAAKVDANELKRGKKYADGGLIAPNGNKSNLTPEQHKLVRTKAFKDWFGDWENSPETSSKVVDENGEPKVMWHFAKRLQYPDERFNVFRVDRQLGSHFGTINQVKNLRYYNIDRNLRKPKIEKKDSDYRFFQVFLNIINPLRMKDEGIFEPKTLANALDSIEKLKLYDWEHINNYTNKSKDSILDRIKYIATTNRGYDGVIYLNRYEATDNTNLVNKLDDASDSVFKNNFPNAEDSWIAFYPEQIKLADGSNTTFDANNPDIRFKEGGNIELALKDLDKAPSVKYWMQPEFRAETRNYEKKGKPDSFVKLYDEKNNADSIIAYDKKGNLVGLFTIAKEGKEKGAFKIVVREDSVNKGWGKKILDEAEKQGIDVVGNIKRNSFTHSGRNLLSSWLTNKMEQGASKYEMGGIFHGTQEGRNLENVNVESILDAIKDKIPANWVGNDVAEISVGNYIWEQINSPKSKNYISESEGKQQIMRDIFSMLFNREREKDSQYSLETGQTYAKIINLDIELFKKKFSIEKIRINDYLRAGIEFKNGDSIILDLTLNLKSLDQFGVRNTGNTFNRMQDIQYWLRNAIQYIDDNQDLILANLKTTNKEWTSKSRGYVKTENIVTDKMPQYLTTINYEDDGKTITWGTKTNRGRETILNKSESDIKEEIEYLKEMIIIGEIEYKNANEQYNKVKDIGSPKMYKQVADALSNLKMVERSLYVNKNILLPFFEKNINSMEQTETTQPIREMGTGANVYFETPFYRLNDNTKGKYILFVGLLNSGGYMYEYSYYYDNLEIPMFVVKELAKIYPNGVPDAVLIDKVVASFEKKWSGEEEIERDSDEDIEIVETKPEYHGISTNVKDYKNPYEVNRAIEKLLDAKGSEQESYTPDEINFISYYSGYGGLEKKGKFSDEELKGLLYEYYTPDEIVQKMWGLAYKYGYGSIGDNSVFEPSVGIGAFLKYAPENVFVAANEINRYSAMICHILYPNVETTLMSFEKNFISRNMSIKKNIEGLKKYSLVIGNPPYGKLGGIYMTMGEDKYVGAANWVEYFIFRGLDLLQKGGLLLYIVGAEQYAGGTLFLDSELTKTKKAIFDKADLIDAYRLPNKLFERTGVSSEIVIFRKR